MTLPFWLWVTIPWEIGLIYPFTFQQIDPPIYENLHPQVKPVNLASSVTADNTSCSIKGWGTLYSVSRALKMIN